VINCFLLDEKFRRSTRQRIQNDTFAENVAAAISEHASNYYQVDPIHRYFESGRDVMLECSREFLDRVCTFGLAYFVQGDTRYGIRAIEEMEAVSSFESWNPDHFLDVAEMAAGLAIGFEWLNPLMSKSQRHRVLNAIHEKAVIPGLREFASKRHWTSCEDNWNVVCNSGLILAALSTLEHQASDAKVLLNNASESISIGFRGFAKDGDYREGYCYWEYASRYAVLAIEAMRAHKVPFSYPPQFRDAWRFGRDTIAPSGHCLNFGDNVLVPDRSPVLGWFANETKLAEVAKLQRESAGRLHPFDLIWLSTLPIEQQNSEPDYQLDRQFVSHENSGIYLLRSKYETGDFYVALKGGKNSSNHSHLDLGAFIIEVDGQRFIGELGRDSYALPGYFDPARRDSFFRVSSSGHGVVGIIASKSANSHCIHNQNSTAQTRLAAKNIEVDHSSITLEIEDKNAPFIQHRSVLLSANGVAVVDQMQSKNEIHLVAEIEWRIFTTGEIVQDGSQALINLGGKTLLAKIVEPQSASWDVCTVETPAGQSDNSMFSKLSFTCALKPKYTRLIVEFTYEEISATVSSKVEKLISRLPLSSTTVQLSERGQT